MGKNDTQRAEKALQRYPEGMGMAMNRAEASTDNRTVEMVAERSRKNQEVLERVSREVSEEAREGIQNAIENSMNLQESLEQDSTKEGSQDNTPDRISRGPGIPDSTDLSSERASGGGAPERSDNGSGDIGSPGISR